MAALGTALGGGSFGQVATAAISPELNAKIHEATKDSKAMNLLAHAALSALEAKATGHSATAGAAAGLIGEGSAMLLSETVLKKPTELLTAEERSLLKAAGLLTGAAADGVVGGNTGSATFGAETGKRAVENNYLFREEQLELNNLRKEKANCIAQGRDCSQIDKRIRELDKLDKDRNYHLDRACIIGSSAECQSQINLLNDAFRSYDKSQDMHNSELKTAFLDVVNRFTEKRQQYMGEVTREALVNLNIDTAKSMAELAYIADKAVKGDIDAIVQLGQIAKETGKAAISPIETTEQTYKSQMAEADKLEAQGRSREADVKRMEAFLSVQMTAIGAVTGGAGLARSAFDTVGKLAIKKGVLSNNDVHINWGGGIQNQGKPWEQYLQTTLPEGTIDLNKIKSNFKVFDHLLPDGTAISAKTMDTVRGYSDPKRLTYQLNKYVDDMVNFKEDGRGRFNVRNDMITSKEMYLAIPHSTTKSQMEAINKSVDYARSQGVKIIVKEVK